MRPWLRWYAPGVPDRVGVPDVALTQLLYDAADDFPRRIALTFLGRTMTYKALVGAVKHFAAALHDLGVRKGDRVALILPNCPQNVIAFFAVLRLGGVVVQHNPLYTPPEFVHQLTDSGATVAIVYDGAYARLAEARPDTPLQHVIVTSLADYLPSGKRLALHLPFAGVREKREQLVAELPPNADVVRFGKLLHSSSGPFPKAMVGPDDLALLQYTGGTTGAPKGAMLTHRNLVANAHQASAWDPDMQRGNETFLAVLPMFHVYGLTMCLTVNMLVAGTLVLLPTFDLGLVFKAIDKWRPTVFPGVPPMYDQIVRSRRTSKHDLRSIRTCVSGAMRLPPETVTKFETVTGGRLVEGYGLTESSPVALANPLNDDARPGTIGLAIPGTDVRIAELDDPGRDVPAGVAGELCVRGPQVFRGYWKQPADSAAMLHDGWLHTGDIAVIDADGFVTIVDRLRDIILASGFSIFPSEIEDVLAEHPAVEECAVAGISHFYRGETVKAFVVLHEGKTVDEARVAQLLRRPAGGLQGADPDRSPHRTAAQHARQGVAPGAACRGRGRARPAVAGPRMGSGGDRPQPRRRAEARPAAGRRRGRRGGWRPGRQRGRRRGRRDDVRRPRRRAGTADPAARPRRAHRRRVRGGQGSPAPLRQRRLCHSGAMRMRARWVVLHGLGRVATRRWAKQGDLQARLIADPSVRADPYPLYEQLRAAGELSLTRIGYVTATHSVAQSILRSDEFRTTSVSSSVLPRLQPIERMTRTGALHPLEAPSLLAVEPPTHTRYRTLVSSVFTARAVAAMREDVQAVADRLLDELAGVAGPVDIVEQYCAQLPVAIISDILGVEQADRRRVFELGEHMAPSLDFALTYAQFCSVERGLLEFDRWLGQHLARLRREPGDNLMSKLIQATVDGQHLNDAELRATAGLVLAAGFETTVNLLGSGVRLLVENPDQLDVLRAEPDRWPNAVDEILRLESPVQMTARVANRDLEIAGRPVPRDSFVAIIIAAANRDPVVFADPTAFDVRRANANRHLAFSGGRHFCLGAALARLEGEVGLRTLFDRYPDLALTGTGTRRPTRVLRGWSSLAVRLGTPAAAAQR